MAVDLKYDRNSYEGRGHLFEPAWTSGWSMNFAAESQFGSEVTKPKPTRTITVKQLTKRG